MTIPLAGWVAPFGHPRIKACSRLPVAFRSVPRPSSPLSAKASTRCPSLRLSATPNGKDHADSRNRISGVRYQSAANSPLRRHFVRESTARPSGQAIGPHAVSRLGHTTRFFTMCHQPTPPAPQKGMLRRRFRSCCRVLACCTRCRRLSGFAFANPCRRDRRVAAHGQTWRFDRWWR